jgi:hypothetical protein
MREADTAQLMTELLQKTSRVEPTRRAVLRPEGGTWHIEFNGTTIHAPDLKGFWHLRELVARPHQPVAALSLIGVSSDEPIASADAGPMLDRQALRQYRQHSRSSTTSWMRPPFVATSRARSSGAPSVMRSSPSSSERQDSAADPGGPARRPRRRAST